MFPTLKQKIDWGSAVVSNEKMYGGKRNLIRRE